MESERGRTTRGESQGGGEGEGEGGEKCDRIKLWLIMGGRSQEEGTIRYFIMQCSPQNFF